MYLNNMIMNDRNRYFGKDACYVEHKDSWIEQLNEYVAQTEVLRELAQPVDNADRSPNSSSWCQTVFHIL